MGPGNCLRESQQQFQWCRLSSGTEDLLAGPMAAIGVISECKTDVGVCKLLDLMNVLVGER